MKFQILENESKNKFPNIHAKDVISCVACSFGRLSVLIMNKLSCKSIFIFTLEWDTKSSPCQSSSLRATSRNKISIQYNFS